MSSLCRTPKPVFQELREKWKTLELKKETEFQLTIEGGFRKGKTERAMKK